MKCNMCRSPRTLKFIDGFGEKRVFCKGCGRSFLEDIFIRLSEQRRLQEFSTTSYYKEIQRPGE